MTRGGSLAVVESVDQTASMYGRSLHGHHVCVLVKYQVKFVCSFDLPKLYLLKSYNLRLYNIHACIFFLTSYCVSDIRPPDCWWKEHRGDTAFQCFGPSQDNSYTDQVVSVSVGFGNSTTSLIYLYLTLIYVNIDYMTFRHMLLFGALLLKYIYIQYIYIYIYIYIYA